MPSTLTPLFREYHFIDDVPSKVSNERFDEAFRQRLIHRAGFKDVPKPMPMRTKRNA